MAREHGEAGRVPDRDGDIVGVGGELVSKLRLAALQREFVPLGLDGGSDEVHHVGDLGGLCQGQQLLDVT